MTDYYDVGGAPADGSHGDSVVIRNEFKAVQDGISKKLPVISGNPSKVVVINAGATKMETATTTGTGDFVRGTSPNLTTPILGTPVSGDATNLTNTIAPQTNAATSKATPVDADAVPLIDSAASFGLKKLTWANIKTALASVFALKGANNDITSLAGLTTALSIAQGGTGASTAAAARSAIGATTTGSSLFTAASATAALIVLDAARPAFAAYQTTLQAIANATFTKVQFQTEEYDTASAFDSTTNYRFTPLVSGYYQVNARTAINAAPLGHVSFIYKNGVSYKRGSNGTLVGATVSSLVFLNTTDYIEIYVYQASGASQNTQTGIDETYFNAVLVRAA